ncbi:uncharacterized protein LOC120126790 [Hibiscus syriacus]|uniref:uncharacterized protein LOC120126790 n=1 Tax=Hibiscus syriacus TaxID=106335 RepID=UPI001921BCDC|nr:uncharacterized protein LOC120126790 [Hibiscus syriacus]
MEIEGSLTVKPPKHIFEEGILEWRYALVGQFIGSTPNFGLLQKTIDLMWNKAALVKVSITGSNLFVFAFTGSYARDWVLENGPWHIQHKPLFLRKWEPNLKELHFDLDRMPIWFQLFNVPLELFSKSGLSYIASAIGMPLHMDSITASRERLEFVRVCIEISVNSKIPDYIDVLLCDDSITRIKVVVPWRPSSCVECKRFGHSVKFCPLGKKQEWRVKQTVHEAKLDDTVNNSIVEAEKQNPIVAPGGSIQTEHIDPCNSEGVVDTCLDKAQAASGDGAKDGTKQITKEGPPGSNPPLKRGRGRTGKTTMGGSKNKFEILASIDPEHLQPVEDSGKKQRAVSLRVAKLVQDLKLKKKEQVEKVMKLEDRGCASSSLNLFC